MEDDRKVVAYSEFEQELNQLTPIQARAKELILTMQRRARVAEKIHGPIDPNDQEFWDNLALRAAQNLWGKKERRRNKSDAGTGDK